MSEHTSFIDAATLDRFVDGELDRDAQRAVLARLDEGVDNDTGGDGAGGDSGGWRRLALAFVESHALSAELRGMVDRTRGETDEADGASVETSHSTPSSAIAWPRALSLAASLLICVGVGFGIGRAWHVGAAPDDSSAPSSSAALAQLPPVTSNGVTGTGMPEGAPRGMVTVHTHDGVPVQLPVYDAVPGDERLLTSNESAVPYEVIRALRSSGLDVKQSRRLWPIDLGDGRQIIVPVDQLDVEYVGYNAYQ